MNKTQENKLSSYQATEEHLDQTLAVYASNVIFKNNTGEFKVKLGELSKLSVVQIEDITGYAEKKDRLEDKLIDTAIIGSSALYAYSFVNNNDHIRESVNVTESYLKSRRDNDVISICKGIQAKLVKYADVLTDTGISKELAGIMEVEIKDFEEIIATPRDKIDTRSTSTEAIKAKFKEIDDILKNVLDKLINVYKFSNTDFYNKYKKSRMIVDYGIRHRKEVEE